MKRTRTWLVLFACIFLWMSFAHAQTMVNVGTSELYRVISTDPELDDYGLAIVRLSNITDQGAGTTLYGGTGIGIYLDNFADTPHTGAYRNYNDPARYFSYINGAEKGVAIL